MGKKNKVLRQQIAMLQIENSLLRSDIRRFAFQQAEYMQEFQEFREAIAIDGGLNMEMSMRGNDVTLSQAFNTAVKLFNISEIAIKSLANRIAEFTGEDINDVVFRAYECSPEEWENLLSTMRACAEYMTDSPEPGHLEG
jgi:hypothetical protein